MRKIVICGWLALAACGGGQKQAAEPDSSPTALSNSTPADPEPPKSESDVAMDKMRWFRDQFCACRDAECAKKVSDDMTVWAQNMSTRTDAPPKMTEEQTKEAQEIGTQMGDCMVRAMQASGPPPSPSSNPCGGP